MNDQAPSCPACNTTPCDPGCVLERHRGHFEIRKIVAELDRTALRASEPLKTLLKTLSKRVRGAFNNPRLRKELLVALQKKALGPETEGSTRDGKQ